MKVGFIIPCTSKGCNWSSVKRSYLYQLTLKTFVQTMDHGHDYHFYIGIDRDDPIFSNKKEQRVIRSEYANKNLHIDFYVMDAPKGYLTKMWNQLFKIAYDEGCDYFYQCGDDISFRTKGWVNDCIRKLQENGDIGLTGPVNNNNRILTQAFVSRKHMEIFGEFFPESIKNWCCDDWYNWVYQPDHFFVLTQHFCSNEGGRPRYDVDQNPEFWNNYQINVGKLREDTLKMALKDREKIISYKLNTMKPVKTD